MHVLSSRRKKSSSSTREGRFRDMFPLLLPSCMNVGGVRPNSGSARSSSKQKITRMHILNVKIRKGICPFSMNPLPFAYAARKKTRTNWEPWKWSNEDDDESRARLNTKNLIDDTGLDRTLKLFSTAHEPDVRAKRRVSSSVSWTGLC